VPLKHFLATSPSDALISWGLYKIAVLLSLNNQNVVSFLNKDCNLIHGNICGESIFVTKAGEWKLAGFEVLTNEQNLPNFIVIITANCSLIAS
jgi:SCY1-like protein 1